MENAESHDHLCRKKRLWLADTELKKAFKAKDDLPFAKLFERWHFPVTSDWPKKCRFGCEKPFESWNERVEHYHTKHFLKRSLESRESDDDNDDIGDDVADRSVRTSSLVPSRASRPRSQNQRRERGRGRGRGSARGTGRGRGAAARQQTRMTSRERNRKYLGPAAVDYLGTQFQSQMQP